MGAPPMQGLLERSFRIAIKAMPFLKTTGHAPFSLASSMCSYWKVMVGSDHSLTAKVCTISVSFFLVVSFMVFQIE